MPRSSTAICRACVPQGVITHPFAPILSAKALGFRDTAGARGGATPAAASPADAVVINSLRVSPFFLIGLPLPLVRISVLAFSVPSIIQPLGYSEYSCVLARGL